jgi:hypothetical protein
MARLFKTPVTVEGDVSVSGNLKSTQSSGDEGGEINLTKAVTNTTLTTGVTIDVYQNKLRFWETGGTNRGYFLDISAGGTSVGTNIIGTATAVSNTVTGTNSADLVYGNMADNDQFRIRVGGTATNAGFVEIATADDGTEPIYVRQYTGVFTTLTRTATILDGSGNTSFPGTVSATSFNSITGLSSTTPSASGTAAVGTATTAARADHVHPTTGLGLTASGLNQFASTTSSQLAGVISDETGSGALVFGTSPTLTTSLITASASFDLINTAATTVNFAGAATTLSIGNTATAAQTVNMFTASTGASTYNFATGAVGTTTTKTLNIGTGAGTAGTTVINMGGNPAVSTSTINLNAGTINSSGATLALFATPTTITQGAAATAVTIGASTGTLTLNNPTIATSVTSGTLALFNTGLTGTLNFAGAATTINIGASTGTLLLRNPTITTSVTSGTLALFNTGLTGTLNFAGAATTINVGASTGTLTLNNPTIATSVTSGTLALFNTGVTGTLNFAGAATTLAIGTTTSTATYNFATGATLSGSTKTINIGTAGVSGSTTTINIGSAVSGATSNITLSGNSTITPAAAVAATSATTAGYMGMPQNAKTASYTLVAADAGKHIYFSGSTGSQTITIPANGSVAYQIGTTITFINLATVSVSIGITTDTMYLAGAGTTGTRTLAANGMATAVKVTSTTWIISGNGLT